MGLRWTEAGWESLASKNGVLLLDAKTESSYWVAVKIRRANEQGGQTAVRRRVRAPTQFFLLLVKHRRLSRLGDPLLGQHQDLIPTFQQGFYLRIGQPASNALVQDFFGEPS